MMGKIIQNSTEENWWSIGEAEADYPREEKFQEDMGSSDLSEELFGRVVDLCGLSWDL